MLYDEHLVGLPKAPPGPQVWELVPAGGYPEPLARNALRRKHAWFRSYVTTIVQRDIRELAHIEALTQIPAILELLATRCASLLNVADISRALGIPQTSLKRYLALLEATFLVYRVPPWSRNLGSRVVKTPKVYLNDTGLLCFLLGFDGRRLTDEPSPAGPILENFAVNELSKQITWSETLPRLHHFRMHSGIEVDVLLEDSRGRCVAIEIKSSATVGPKDLKGLRFLQQALGNAFHRGVLLYTGTASIPFERNIHALPIQTLWAGGPAR